MVALESSCFFDVLFGACFKFFELECFGRSRKSVKSSMDDFPIDILQDGIFTFVGDFQFLFVAAVNKKFHEAYSCRFPERKTRLLGTTLEHVPKRLSMCAVALK
jgi:hypothetical protein